MCLRVITSALAIALLSALSASPVIGQEAPARLPVEIWADTDQVRSLDMSPNGERVALLMRRERGAEYELMMFDTDDIAGTFRAISTDNLLPRSLFWANDQHLVVSFILKETIGTEDVRLGRIAAFDTEESRWTALMRLSQRNVRDRSGSNYANLGIGGIASRLPDDPDHVLVSHAKDSGEGPNQYRVNVATGQRSLVLRGNTRFGNIVFDRTGEARGASEYDAAANRIIVYAREDRESNWREIGTVNADDRLRFDLLGFYDPDRPNIATILADSADVNTTGVYEVDIETGERELLFRHPEFDAAGVITSPRQSDGDKIIGYSYLDAEGRKREFIDNEFEALYTNLEGALPGRDVFIQRVSEDGNTTLFYSTAPEDPGTWYLMRDGQAAPIMRRNNEIPMDALSPTFTIEYVARDGLPLSGYVTVPGGGEGPFPVIAMPHGGPWVRDVRGYDEWAQMLANQGWMVFQPNYRGSTNLGRAHWVAGDREWGLAMQDDVEDGVQALIEEGLADPDRLGFFGWSYGGYSAFVAAVRENSMFNCSVAGAGVSDLSRIRGGLAGDRFLREFQKPTIEGVTPLEHAGRVTMPMLVVHGDADETVPVAHSRRWMDAVREDLDINYIEIEDMRHSPLSYEHNMQWYPELVEFFETKCGF